MVSGAKHLDTFLWLKHYPKGVQWNASVKTDVLYQLLDDAAAKKPKNPCIDFLGKKFSYAETKQLSDKVAKSLQSMGVTKGVRVGLFMPNSPHFIFFYYGILKAGGTVVNYNPLYIEHEIQAQIDDSQTEIMVTLDLEALYSKLQPLLGKGSFKRLIVCPVGPCLPFPKNILFPLLKRKDIADVRWSREIVSYADMIKNDGHYVVPDINPDEDIALFQYTGGTTGIAKAAMLTHANVSANAYQAYLWFHPYVAENEKVLAALPLFHVFAMTVVMNLALTVGAEIYMMFPRFQVEEAMRLVQKHKITFFPAVPTIYNLIISHPNVKKFDLSSLKVCLSGGAPLPVEIIKKFKELTGCFLIEGYGLSETAPAALVNPIDGLVKDGSIGLPLPGTYVKVMSLENPDEEMPLGESGEICLAGPQVMKGYWNRPDETSKVMKDGLFRTGDVGYMDPDGYVFLVDRIKDMIISNGYNVYPRHVEEALYQHPDIEEATVIGIPDDSRGEVPKAFVKIKKGISLTSNDIMSFLRDKLSPIQLPKQIEIRDELPKTMIGKLSKKELVQEEKQKIRI